MPHPPLRLGVNVDHVATLRNARAGRNPDPVRAALVAIEAGADGITAHLREDRRHIRDEDMARLKAEISKPLNFEMAATADMLRIALATKPHAVCLVPERREELTTEGGLDAVGQHNTLAPLIGRLSDAGVRVSLFIAADPAQIEMAAKLHAPVIEIHTGAWCDAVVDGHQAKAESEWQRIVAGAALGRSVGLEVHAGHGLDYATAEKIASLPEIVELNIGYYMIGEALIHGPCRDGSRHACGDGPWPHECREFRRCRRGTGGQGMIIGVGSDLIDIRRVAKVIERHGDRFLDRIFTDAERARAGRRAKNEKMVVATYAKRFAAKEACSKALGTGIRRGVWWRDMGVVNLPGGRPTMQLTGGALARLEAMTPQGYEARIDLSITDDWPLAQAFVIISAVATSKP
jgi:pyridoxine 5-phosphate synthase